MIHESFEKQYYTNLYMIRRNYMPKVYDEFVQHYFCGAFSAHRPLTEDQTYISREYGKEWPTIAIWRIKKLKEVN